MHSLPNRPDTQYRHTPQRDLNSRLNIVVALTLACVLGLGLGHFLGECQSGILLVFSSMYTLHGFTFPFPLITLFIHSLGCLYVLSFPSVISCVVPLFLISGVSVQGIEFLLFVEGSHKSNHRGLMKLMLL